MITRLGVRGFKSWDRIDSMRLADITVLFGSNSSGKTSLLQLLLMLKQTAESTDRKQVLNLGDDRSLVELGTYQDVVHGHDVAAPLEWTLEWSTGTPLKIEDPEHRPGILLQGSSFGLETQIAWIGNGQPGRGQPSVRRMEYWFGGSKFGMNAMGESSSEYDLFTEGTEFRFRRNPGRAWKLPPPTKCYGFPDQVRGYYANAGFLSDLELQFVQLMANTYYLGPLRDHPRRQYTWGGAQPADMGRRGEKVIDAILASRESGAVIKRGRGHKRETLEQRVAAWLKELGLIHTFAVRPVTPEGKLFQVWVRRRPGSAEVLLTDVGFGVSQILPVIALCYYAPEGSTLLLEQPEIHLHPSVQAGLADVFVDAMKTRGVQIIVESHSEHLLRRLQRRVAEEELNPEKAALYFCATEGSTSVLNPLRLDLFGAIDNWPPDFFGDEFGEIAATAAAGLRRRGSVGS